jgi:hypothetical protein
MQQDPKSLHELEGSTGAASTAGVVILIEVKNIVPI